MVVTVQNVPTAEEWLNRIRAEFREMPGMRLTEAQARRLWGLDDRMCGTLLEMLTGQGFLQRAQDGHYSRRG
jgi:hypothetical protein